LVHFYARFFFTFLLLGMHRHYLLFVLKQYVNVVVGIVFDAWYWFIFFIGSFFSWCRHGVVSDAHTNGTAYTMKNTTQ
jgi:hypothetical protein